MGSEQLTLRVLRDFKKALHEAENAPGPVMSMVLLPMGQVQKFIYDMGLMVRMQRTAISHLKKCGEKSAAQSLQRDLYLFLKGRLTDAP